jgi:hypothetical protein
MYYFPYFPLIFKHENIVYNNQDIGAFCVKKNTLLRVQLSTSLCCDKFGLMYYLEALVVVVTYSNCSYRFDYTVLKQQIILCSLIKIQKSAVYVRFYFLRYRILFNNNKLITIIIYSSAHKPILHNYCLRFITNIFIVFIIENVYHNFLRVTTINYFYTLEK